MRLSPIAKWCSERSVWAPQYRSARTSIRPMLSVSTRVARSWSVMATSGEPSSPYLSPYRELRSASGFPGRSEPLGALAGPVEPPAEWCKLEERHGYAGALPSAGGLGGPIEAQVWCNLEERHGYAGALPSAGALAGPVEAQVWCKVEERHGYAGALPSAGGLGGPVEAPHVVITERGSRTRGRRRSSRCRRRWRAPVGRGGSGVPEPRDTPSRRSAGSCR